MKGRRADGCREIRSLDDLLAEVTAGQDLQLLPYKGRPIELEAPT